MKTTRIISILLSAVAVLSFASLAGCGDDQSTAPQVNYVSDGEDVSVNNISQATTVSQPSVDKNSFPENIPS